MKKITTNSNKSITSAKDDQLSSIEAVEHSLNFFVKETKKLKKEIQKGNSIDLEDYEEAFDQVADNVQRLGRA